MTQASAETQRALGVPPRRSILISWLLGFLLSVYLCLCRWTGAGFLAAQIALSIVTEVTERSHFPSCSCLPHCFLRSSASNSRLQCPRDAHGTASTSPASPLGIRTNRTYKLNQEIISPLIPWGTFLDKSHKPLVPLAFANVLANMHRAPFTRYTDHH